MVNRMGGKAMNRRHPWLWFLVGSIILLSFPAVGATAPPKSLIAAGDYHTLAIHKDGSLWAWGKNDLGQLGLGDYLDRKVPTRVGNATDWVAVAAGADHSLALKSSGTLWAWGYNYYGELGLGNTNNTLVVTPTQVVGTGWTAMAAGGHYSLGLKTDGTLYAWGRNEYGQFGTGTFDISPYPPHPSPSPVGSGYLAIAAAFDHNLALNTDGYTYTCGLNNYGQLGLGSYGNTYVTTRQPVANYFWVLAAGADTSFAITPSGYLWSWGLNNYGSLGLDPPYSDANPNPRTVSGANWIAAAGGGEGFSLGLQVNGSLWAWGNNEYGELGQGVIDSLAHYSPLQVGKDTHWAAIAAGRKHCLAFKADGSLWAWGDNSYGQLGLGDTINRASPAKVWPRAYPGIDLLLLVN